jgi:hypothetical protein
MRPSSRDGRRALPSVIGEAIQIKIGPKIRIRKQEPTCPNSLRPGAGGITVSSENRFGPEIKARFCIYWPVAR